jgi:hypothetical protein
MTAKQVNDALAGLPYASSSGRTAITWLWERALKDPPPAPKARRVTAEEIEESRAATRSKPPVAPVPPLPVPCQAGGYPPRPAVQQPGPWKSLPEPEIEAPGG